MDQAAEYIAQATQRYLPLSPVEEKRLIRRIDWILVPMLPKQQLWLPVTCARAVDKVAISTAAIYGLREGTLFSSLVAFSYQTALLIGVSNADLNLSGDQYSWTGSILYFGCIFGMLPSSYVLQRVPSAKYLAGCSFGWSVLSLLIPACRDFADLMTLRFLMGCLEGIIVPSISLVIAGFYKKVEQPPRNAIVFAAISSVINGFLSWAVGQIPSTAPLAKWQYLFLITGSISLAWSIFAFLYLPDTPMNAWFLNDQEKLHIITRLAENKTGIVNKTWKREQAIEAVIDPKTWIIFLFNIAINIPNGGLITFSGIIINGLGFTAVQTSLLNMPTGVMSTLSAFLFSWIAAKWTNRRCLVTMVAAFVPAVGAVIVYTLPRSNIGGQMVGIYLLYTYFGPYVLGISLGQANTAGHTKKNVQYSIMYIGYAVGNLIGPQTFRANQAPAYTGGFITMLICYCICIGLMAVYWILASILNARREAENSPLPALATINPNYVSDVDSLSEPVFADMTDFQQQSFRYTT
ncbi:hypothetical protein UA08_02032 [Talaromyces atroroseus]|uniref:Major facilitator superfamily (MFS) profile domain-containing protein n=1 Tax=Talaromyces atroroseus TaxID=1441469 RepID=A0A1Q5QC67_TALAT|nr:hypothetical protein UA08_02032 [Talaromyces atroroseus]OKL63547.1 hypothetical protein UA08_02032 [Talaromyces atroroseus]